MHKLRNKWVVNPPGTCSRCHQPLPKETLLEKVKKNTRIEGDCHIWLGPVSTISHLPRIWITEKKNAISVYRALTGHIRNHSTCSTPRCINPKHIAKGKPSKQRLK